MANSGKDINFGADLLPTETGVYSLGSSTKKWIVESIPGESVEICTCATAAATAAKVVTTTNSGWALKTGAIIAIKFTASNTASSVTLNVNGTGAKSIWYAGAAYTSTSASVCGYANRYCYYVYDGTYWVWIGWNTDANNDTYDRNKYTGIIKAQTELGNGNIICGTENGYNNLKSGTAFNITYPILYKSGALSAGKISNSGLYDVLAVEINDTQNIVLTAYKPVYIKGTLNGTTFTPVSTTSLTQTVPTTSDGYYYMLLGIAFYDNGLYMQAEHPIYIHDGYNFKLLQQTDDEVVIGSAQPSTSSCKIWIKTS